MGKKLLSNYCFTILFAVALFLVNVEIASAHEYTNYNNIIINSEEYIALLNLGFNEDEIYYMDLETFEANKDLDATLLTRDVKYLKTVYPAYGNNYTVEVTEEEYNNQSEVVPFSTVITEYKTMVSTISQNGSKYRYKVSVSWKNMPSKRSYDIIGIGFNDDVYINSSVYFSYYYYNSSGTATTSTTYYDKKSLSTGGTAVYKLPSSSIVGLGAALYYDVSKNTSSTLTTIRMCGDYAHATSNVSSTTAANHSVGISGIELTASNINSYDDIPCATAIESVNW